MSQMSRTHDRGSRSPARRHARKQPHNYCPRSQARLRRHRGSPQSRALQRPEARWNAV